MGLIVPKAIFLRWSVRDLRYSQRFLSQKSSSSHKLFRLTKKIKKSQNLWELIDQFTNAIQYNTIYLSKINKCIHITTPFALQEASKDTKKQQLRYIDCGSS